jgi:ABC-type branched-subunit amino acid transport system substrate-binding protein
VPGRPRKIGGDHRFPRGRRLVALGAALLLVAACGSRANPGQVAEALGNGAGTGVGRATGATGVGTAGGAGTGPGGAAVAASSDAGAGPGDAGTAGGGPDAANAAPDGGNGGATDIGVTADSITVANISILTGPVPGLFAGAPKGVQAYFAYINSQGGIYGRQLKVESQDDQFDCGINKATTEEDLTKYFTFVGSFSLFDDCGGEVLQAHPDVPDIQVPLGPTLQTLPNNFAPQPVRAGASTGPFQYIKDHHPNAITKVGSLIGNVDAAKSGWLNAKATMESLGYQVVYERIFQPTETDFTADIVQMKAKGVQLLTLSSADVKTMGRVEAKAQQQGWKPEVTLLGAAGYDNTLFTLAGSNDALEGDYLYLPTAMYLGEDRQDVPEVDTFLTWLNNVAPGANVDLFTVYGWASAELFVQALKDAGPQATRASLMASLQKIDQFDGNGMLAPGGPASKTPATCYIMAQVHDGKFQRVDSPPGQFRCDGTYFFRQGG